MSETQKGPADQKTDQSDKPSLTQEMIRYSDGRAGLYFRTRGETFDWSLNKHTKSLSNQGSPDVAIVSTESGRFALGCGAIMKISNVDPDTQEHIKIPEGNRPIALLDDLSPGGLRTTTIGEVWDLIPDQGSVQEILVDYKSGEFPDAHQVPAENPFDKAKDALREYAEQLAK